MRQLQQSRFHTALDNIEKLQPHNLHVLLRVQASDVAFFSDLEPTSFHSNKARTQGDQKRPGQGPQKRQAWSLVLVCVCIWSKTNHMGHTRFFSWTEERIQCEKRRAPKMSRRDKGLSLPFSFDDILLSSSLHRYN